MAKKSYTVAKEELAKETAFYQVNSSSVRDPEYPEDYYKNIEEIARDYKVDYDAVKESVNRIVEAKYQQLVDARLKQMRPIKQSGFANRFK